MHCCANGRCSIEKRALLFDSAYEFSPIYILLSATLRSSTGSFIKERYDLDDNSCRTCDAHGMLAVAMKLALWMHLYVYSLHT